MRAKSLLIVLGMACIAPMFGASASLAADPERGAQPGAVARVSTESASVWAIHVDTWQLLQSDGSELYEQLCASCHGTVGPEQVLILEANPVVAPDLTHLSAAGVPRAHWTYVIESPCEDGHHWASHGIETMPCWRRIFREALNSSHLPMLVSAKLGDYLESVQN